MPYLSKEDKERIAMGLMAYKKTLNLHQSPDNSLVDYNKIELDETDNLAERLGLDKEYYEPGMVI
jgi:hypothetical protein